MLQSLWERGSQSSWGLGSGDEMAWPLKPFLFLSVFSEHLPQGLGSQSSSPFPLLVSVPHPILQPPRLTGICCAQAHLPPSRPGDDLCVAS